MRRLIAVSNNAAADLARMRWEGVSAEERTEAAKKAANARWAGHAKKSTAKARSRRKKPSKP